MSKQNDTNDLARLVALEHAFILLAGAAENGAFLNSRLLAHIGSLKNQALLNGDETTAAADVAAALDNLRKRAYPRLA